MTIINTENAGCKRTKRQYDFYPTVLKGCQGIVFTRGVQMGGRGKKLLQVCNVMVWP